MDRLEHETSETRGDARLVLASSSPRRQGYLRDLGLTFQALAADVDEDPLAGEAPRELAVRLARAKAHTVAGRLAPGAYLVVGSDTVVALGQEVLGKPVDDADATRMLVQLQGRPHQVLTAVCVLDTAGGQEWLRVNDTTVVMRDYSAQEIADYVATGDPLDKAGAYAIQHPTFAPASSIQGCLSSVVGLPLGDLHDLLTEAGVAVAPVASVCRRRTHFPCCRDGID